MTGLGSKTLPGHGWLRPAVRSQTCKERGRLWAAWLSGIVLDSKEDDSEKEKENVQESEDDGQDEGLDDGAGVVDIRADIRLTGGH